VAADPTGSKNPAPDWAAVVQWDVSPACFQVVATRSPLVARQGPLTLILDGELCDNGDSADARDGPEWDDAHRLLADYLRYGAAVFERRRGFFTTCIWDSQQASLLCARDPTGAIPLFYASSKHRLVVSPSPRRVMQEAGCKAEINRLSVAAHVFDLPSKVEETFLRPVHRLLAGHLLEARSTKVRIRRYWDPEDTDRVLPSSFEELLENFDALLHEAVQRCLGRSRGGIFLSGGLDSASVATSAADVSDARGLERPAALSLILPGTANEEANQRMIAAELDLEILAVALDEIASPGKLLHAALALNGTSEGPPAGLLAPAYNSLALSARNTGCSVLLTGDGGDEWLALHPLYVADRLMRFDVLQLMRIGKAWYSYWPVLNRRKVASAILWRWGIRALLRAYLGGLLSEHAPKLHKSIRSQRIFNPLPSWFVPDSTLRAELVDWVMEASPEVTPRSLYRSQKRSLLDHPNFALSQEGNYASWGRLGLPFRAPLLDPDVVSFLYAAPGEAMLRSGHAKALAWAFLNRRLPNLRGRAPRKVYADVVWEEAVRQGGRAAWDALAGPRVLSELGIVEERLLAESLREGGSRARDAVQCWQALDLETWLRSRRV
jgi:asparagine synthetase B (glutamine-hydrolysing)